jgi:hypothetical protein
MKKILDLFFRNSCTTMNKNEHLGLRMENVSENSTGGKSGAIRTSDMI